MRYVVLRTHGGLGNQLFQILYGRLFAEAHKCDLREVHDSNYKHQFSRATTPAVTLAPSLWQSAVSAARIPKVLNRTYGRAETPWRFLGDWYLDGYFQHVEQYRDFTEKSISHQLKRIAHEMIIGPASDDAILVHLRVGDFFGDRETARRHVIDRLKSIPSGAHIMTNDEILLEDPEISGLIAGLGACLVTTRGFSSEDVLRTLSRYRQIDANESTLTVWAQVLAGTRVNFRDHRISALATYLGNLGRKKCFKP